MSVPVTPRCGVGAGSKVNWSAALVALVPPTVVTVISTVPAVEGGDVAVIDPSEFTVNEVAATPPKSTAEAPVNPVPVIVTDVPPFTVPLVVAIADTVGSAM